MTSLLVRRFSKIRGTEAIIFALVLLFLPVNLAKHFFFDFVYVEGILVDYLIPTVYLTDILIWGLLGIWLFRFLRRFSTNHLTIQPFSHFSVLYSLFLILLVSVSGLSIFGAVNQPAAFYKWLKLVEYVLFSFYVSKHIDLKKDWPTIVKLLSIGVLFESVLAILQWFKQGSIFGYYFLGENKYNVSTPGIATFDFFGTKKVRSYGTTPHPNVLGGYLAILLPWVFDEIMSKSQMSNLKTQNYSSKLKTLSMGSFVVGLVALYLSFGRSAWVVGILGLLGVLALNFKGFPSSILHPPSSVFYSLSFLRRAELNWIALQMIKDHPLLGVGLNNFTVRMDEYGKVSGWVRFLQPVHNVYLLVAAEIGLLGLVVFVSLLLFTIYGLRFTKPKSLRRLLFISLSQVLALCLFDHYFWTLQQTSLLFWLMVGLVFAARNNV